MPAFRFLSDEETEAVIDYVQVLSARGQLEIDLIRDHSGARRQVFMADVSPEATKYECLSPTMFSQARHRMGKIGDRPCRKGATSVRP